MTSKQLKVTLSRPGVEKKTWSVFKPLEIKAVAQNVTIVHPPSLASITNVIPAKKAGCGCGAKKPVNGAAIHIQPPIINNRLAGAGRRAAAHVYTPINPPIIAPVIQAPQNEQIEKIVMQNVEQWGRPTWTLLHLHASYYSNNPTPLETKQKLSFFKAIIDGIPCHTCKAEAEAYCKTHPIENAMKNGCELSKWTLDFHNNVNVRLKKKVWTMAEMSKEFKLETIPC